MAFLGLGRKREREQRASLENPAVSLSDPDAWRAMFGGWTSATGIEVTPEKAMGVAAFWSGVAFLSATLASVPLYMFRLTEAGPEKARNDQLTAVLNDAPNEETSSFRWRQMSMISLLHEGRSFSLIEKNQAGRLKNIWFLENSKMEVERVEGRLRYTYTENNKKIIYRADQILDLIWMPKPDNISHYNPIATLRNTLGLSLALEDYAAKFFQNGGVPPLQLVGPLGSPQAVERAGKDLSKALRAAREDSRPILPMPLSHELKAIGVDPEKGQLNEARQFQLLETARILGLPPIFLQDLSHGTFSNTEQQDLHLVKHTIRQWFRRWEDELNLKLVSPRNRSMKIRFDEDELLRGDFKTRMEGYAMGVQNALIKPDEGREAMGWPRDGGEADKLHVQGATVPLGSQMTQQPAEVDAQEVPSDDEAA